MQICKTCKRWVEDMRDMIARYDKTGSVKGNRAFDKFLLNEGDGTGTKDDDVTIPLDDDIAGMPLGARQAIVMGYSENAMGEGGLEALERELNRQKGFY